MSDIKDCLAKHIRMSAHYLTVEPDGDKRVQSLKYQEETLILAEWLFCALEADTIPPFSPFHPGAFIFVSIVKGIVDTTGFNQCLMHVAGCRDVYPITRIKLLSKYVASNSLSRGEILQFPEIKHVRPFLT